jgi:hypothetical protein
VINVGFSIAATLGGALASASFLLLFLGDGLTSLLFALVIAWAVPETRPPCSTVRRAIEPAARCATS